MKAFLLGLIFMLFFMIGFFLLSLIGLLWMDYHTVISNGEWFGIYCFLFGWWIAGVPCAEIYEEWYS